MQGKVSRRLSGTDSDLSCSEVEMKEVESDFEKRFLAVLDLTAILGKRSMAWAMWADLKVLEDVEVWRAKVRV